MPCSRCATPACSRARCGPGGWSTTSNGWNDGRMERWSERRFETVRSFQRSNGPTFRQLFSAPLLIQARRILRFAALRPVLDGGITPPLGGAFAALVYSMVRPELVATTRVKPAHPTVPAKPTMLLGFRSQEWQPLQKLAVGPMIGFTSLNHTYMP